MVTKRRLVWALMPAVLLAAVYFGLSWYIVDRALTAEVSEFENHPADFALDPEDVEFSPRGEDDVTLRGWWFPKDDAPGTVIWVHGLDANRADGLPLIRDLYLKGFSVLAFDLRGHGESDRVSTGAGFFEVNDARGAIDYLANERGVEPGTILLMGESFGAAIVLMAGVGETALLGVYADSAFAELSDMLVGEVAARTPIPEWVATLLKPGIVLIGDLARGVEIDKVSPATSAALYDYPLRLVHCTADERIPHLDNLVPISEAATEAEVTLFPDCAHTDGYDEFPVQYVDTIVDHIVERQLTTRPEES